MINVNQCLQQPAPAESSPVEQQGICGGLLGAHAVHDALVEVRGSNLPGAGSEVDVVRVMDLGQVVEGAALRPQVLKIRM